MDQLKPNPLVPPFQCSEATGPIAGGAQAFLDARIIADITAERDALRTENAAMREMIELRASAAEKFSDDPRWRAGVVAFFDHLMFVAVNRDDFKDRDHIFDLAYDGLDLLDPAQAVAWKDLNAALRENDRLRNALAEKGGQL